VRPVEKDKRDLFDWAVGLAQIGAIVGVGLLFWQIRRGNKADRIQRSADFLQRYFTGELRALNSVAAAYVSVADAADCVSKIGAWELSPHAEAQSLPRSPRDRSSPQASRNGLAQALDFFEEFGAAYNKRLLDKRMVHVTIAPVPVQILNMAWWFVCWRRKGELVHENTLYSEWERAVRRIWRTRKELRSQKPSPKIRLLILPPADRQAWERHGNICGRLSKALSDYLAEDSSRSVAAIRRELADDVLTLDRQPGRKVVDRVFAIPPRIDVKAGRWDVERRAAESIQRHLWGLDVRGLRTLAEKYEARLPAPGE
jgi:hypothetical protein